MAKREWSTIVSLWDVIAGVLIGICIAIVFSIIREHRRRMRGYKKRQEWLDLGYTRQWSTPSAKDTVMRYSMNVDANTVEKLQRMQMLHGFDNPGMAVRRAIDITVQLDQLLPNGGTIVTIDDNGAEVPFEIVKIKPEDS